MKYDQHENCAKCGYPGKRVEYEQANGFAYGRSPIEIVERLRLTCSRCGFQWFRDCLDKEEA